MGVVCFLQWMLYLPNWTGARATAPLDRKGTRIATAIWAAFIALKRGGDMLGMAVAFVIWIVALGVVVETVEALGRLWRRWF